jgi:hypothetical protein
MGLLKGRSTVLLGCVLLLLTIVTVGQFVVQQQRSAAATQCQNALLQIIVSRSSASNEERTALRAVITGLPSQGDVDPGLVASRYQAYSYAIARADAVYASSGRLDDLQQRCAAMQNN